MNRKSITRSITSRKTPQWFSGAAKTKVMDAATVTTAQLVVVSSRLRQTLERWISAR